MKFASNSYSRNSVNFAFISFAMYFKCHFYCRHGLGYTRKYPTFQLAGTLRFNYFTVLSVRFPNLFCYKVVFFRLFFEKNQVVILLVAACLLS